MTDRITAPVTAGAGLTISTEPVDADHAVLTLAGRLDAVEAVRVRQRLAEPDLAGVGHLVVDLADVTFVDSAGLAALARARRDRVFVDGSVTLVRPRSEEAMRVFRLTQFDQIFTMLDGRGGGPAR